MSHLVFVIQKHPNASQKVTQVAVALNSRKKRLIKLSFGFIYSYITVSGRLGTVLVYFVTKFSVSK